MKILLNKIIKIIIINKIKIIKIFFFKNKNKPIQQKLKNK